jgi:hypothetical protein
VVLEIARPRAPEQVLRRVRRDDAALPQQDELVAPLRLVHHVARHEQRRAVVGEPVEHRPQVSPQHGIETDRRLVEHEHLGPSEQRRRQRDA